MAIDPVCKMEVEESKAAATSEYKGKKYYFCAIAEYIVVVTSVLREAIGTIEAGLWPRQEVSPVLLLGDFLPHREQVISLSLSLMPRRSSNRSPHFVHWYS